jgi:transcriptional regulator with XRE-family HTH domain
MTKVAECRERLVELLKINGLTKAEFCRKTGIDNSAMTRYINGERVPRQDKVAAIAEAFNVDPAWLMGYDVPMYNIMKIEARIKHAEVDTQLERLQYYYGKLSKEKRNHLEEYARYLSKL